MQELSESSKELLVLIVETIKSGKPTIRYLGDGYGLIYPVGGNAFFMATFQTINALEAKLGELEKEYKV